MARWYDVQWGSIADFLCLICRGLVVDSMVILDRGYKAQAQISLNCNNPFYLSFSIQLSHPVVIASPNKGPLRSLEWLSISLDFLCHARPYAYSNSMSIQNIHRASKAGSLQPRKCHHFCPIRYCILHNAPYRRKDKDMEAALLQTNRSLQECPSLV